MTQQQEQSPPTEEEKARRVPGIVFVDCPVHGRDAVIAGTGLEVYIIVDQYRAMEESWDHLRLGFHWLSDAQLQAALAYAEAFPDEIEPIIEELANVQLEDVWREFPETNPYR